MLVMLVATKDHSSDGLVATGGSTANLPDMVESSNSK
jgi:hypothetical protein